MTPLHAWAARVVLNYGWRALVWITNALFLYGYAQSSVEELQRWLESGKYAELETLQPQFRERVVQWLDVLTYYQVDYRITSVTRTKEQQEILYRRRGEGSRLARPVAPPSRSLHEYGLAVDVLISRQDELPAAVAWAEYFGIVWAGEADPVHFAAERSLG